MPRAYATVKRLEACFGFRKSHRGSRTDIPALRHEDAHEEEDEANAGTDPSVQDKGRRPVQESLVLLRLLASKPTRR